MRFIRHVLHGIRALLRSRQADADVEDEIAHYLDEATAQHEARGLSPRAARRAARLEMGGAVVAREQVRSSGWEHVVESTAADVRHALRRLRQNPGFTLTAVATLAIGIGASTAVFSAVSPVLLEPLPYPDAERLVTIDDWSADGTPMDATLGTYAELLARVRALDAVAAVDAWRPSLTGSDAPEQFEGRRVTANYLHLLGAVPIAGRGFTEKDDRRGAPSVVVLSHGLAERRFGGAREVVGRHVDLNGDPYLVVGVLPPGFTDVLAPTVEIWSPLREQPQPDFNGREWGHHYRLIGRLGPSTTIDAARVETLATGRSPVAEFPRPSWASLANGLLVRPLQQAVTEGVRPTLYAIVAAVILVLAIASVNVANLLLARGAQRHGEFAMRMALGAGRSRLIRQLVTESVVLASLGGVVGLGLAWVGVAALVAVSPPGLPRVDAIRLSAPVFVFAAAVTSCVGLLIGLIPARAALRSVGSEGAPRGPERTTGPSSAQRALVIAEVALSLVLLVNAGLLFRSVRLLLSVEPGFEAAHVVTLQVVEAGPSFDSDAARLQFVDRVLAAVRGVPGVQHAAFTSLLPLAGEVDGYGLEAQSRPGRNGEDGSALRYAVTPEYFETMRIPLIAGRLIDETDRPGETPKVLINEGLARRLFGSAGAIGERVRFGPQIERGGPWAEVVGVVGDVRHYSLGVEAPGAFYVANGQWEWVDNVQTLVVRVAAPRAALVADLRRAVWSVSADVPIRRVAAMADFVGASAGTRRFALLAIETLAITALLLAIVGLYGVVSGYVSDRVREIGIRTALGASSLHVVGQVVRHAETLTLAGAAIGLVGAYLSSRLIESMLFGVSGLDPLTYASVTALMATAALLAAWAPARRAARVDPTVALRSE